ncbi:MAG: hypothetical protein RLZZ496_788 [Pseudomonadota bacterium]|nr:hypothetical protein [Alphaproteobacteria bacterium]
MARLEHSSVVSLSPIDLGGLTASSWRRLNALRFRFPLVLPAALVEIGRKVRLFEETRVGVCKK